MLLLRGVDVGVGARFDQLVGEHLRDAVVTGQRPGVVDPCVVRRHPVVGEALMLSGELVMLFLIP